MHRYAIFEGGHLYLADLAKGPLFNASCVAKVTSVTSTDIDIAKAIRPEYADRWLMFGGVSVEGRKTQERHMAGSLFCKNKLCKKKIPQFF